MGVPVQFRPFPAQALALPRLPDLATYPTIQLPLHRQETEPKATTIDGQNTARAGMGALGPLSWAARPARPSSSCIGAPTPTPPGSLTASPGIVNTRQQQANKLPTPFISQAPDLIRFSSFLPVLGQSLLKTVENSFAPAVRKRLSPVRKIIKPSSHIRGNESPFPTQFSGRLFSSALAKEL